MGPTWCEGGGHWLALLVSLHGDHADKVLHPGAQALQGPEDLLRSHKLLHGVPALALDEGALDRHAVTAQLCRHRQRLGRRIDPSSPLS